MVKLYTRIKYKEKGIISKGSATIPFARGNLVKTRGRLEIINTNAYRMGYRQKANGH